MGNAISMLISLIAYKCGNLPFETAFFYVSLAMGLYEFILSLQKIYKQRETRRKRNQNTHDTNSKPDKTNATWVDYL